MRVFINIKILLRIIINHRILYIIIISVYTYMSSRECRRIAERKKNLIVCGTKNYANFHKVISHFVHYVQMHKPMFIL